MGRKIMIYAGIAIAGLVVIVLFLTLRPGADLERVFNDRRAVLLAGLPPPAPALTEGDIAHLPAPVQTWIRRSGALGKPPVRAVETRFEAELFQGPGQPGMPGPAVQIDVVDPPARLFFMTARMKGLPVKVLHEYGGDTASMQVRIARLADAVRIGGPDFARTETVTFLNDLCVYAPSALVGPAFTWHPVSDKEAGVTYTRGGTVVRAVLTFDAAGDLVDFASDDRGALQADGSLKMMRWTTPLSDYKKFGGRRAASKGAAIWHEAEGPFTYGTFRTAGVEYH